MLSASAEINDTIASQVQLSCCVETSPELEDITIAIKNHGLTTESLPIILASFFPNASPSELEQAGNIAGRELNCDEIAYRWVNETTDDSNKPSLSYAGDRFRRHRNADLRHFFGDGARVSVELSWGSGGLRFRP